MSKEGPPDLTPFARPKPHSYVSKQFYLHKRGTWRIAQGPADLMKTRQVGSFLSEQYSSLTIYVRQKTPQQTGDARLVRLIYGSEGENLVWNIVFAKPPQPTNQLQQARHNVT